MAGCNEFNLVVHGLGFLFGLDEDMSVMVSAEASARYSGISSLFVLLSFSELVRPGVLYLAMPGISQASAGEAAAVIEDVRVWSE